MKFIQNNADIPSVTSDGRGASVFGVRHYSINGEPERRLSDQIPAVNFRLRSSDPGYASGWHVAGDPTLLIMLSGTVRITLRNGESRDFSAGDMFIAEDYLVKDVLFDDTLHGHKAEVVGKGAISVLHLKLEKRDV